MPVLSMSKAIQAEVTGCCMKGMALAKIRDAGERLQYDRIFTEAPGGEGDRSDFLSAEEIAENEKAHARPNGS